MVIGLAVGITVAVVAALFFFCHRKQRRQGKSADGPGGSGGIGIPSMNRDQAWNMDFAFSLDQRIKSSRVLQVSPFIKLKCDEWLKVNSIL